MSAFKPKRVSGAELVGQISQATQHLPPAIPVARGARPPRKVQVNFQASEAMADLLATEAAKAGSLRRFIARLLREKGYDIPEADVNPMDTRKRGRGLLP